MRKILVIGSGGAGKSTFAARLGRILALEVIHLDVFYWQPGWVETPKDVWQQRVAELAQRDSWIMDGNFSGTLSWRLAACDTVIFLDMPRTLCLWRVLKRLAQYRNSSNRPDMAAGCREKLNLEFLRWVWNYPQRTKPKVAGMLREQARGKQVVWLRTPAEAESFLTGLQELSQLQA